MELMPKPEKIDRNAKIAQDVKKLNDMDIKYSAQKVALKYGISKRRVFAILKRMKTRRLKLEEKETAKND